MSRTQKTSLATVKDFNSFTERIKGERVGCVLTWHCRKAERHSDFVRGTRLDPCIYSEAPQTSLPLKALPYWHLTFLTQGQRKWQIFSSVWTICFFFFSFSFLVFRISTKSEEGRLQKAYSTNPLRIANPLFKVEVNLKCWNEVYLLKIFYWGSKWDLEQSTVYVIYLIQESRSLENHVLEPLDPYKIVPSNQPNFCIDFIYIVWR